MVVSRLRQALGPVDCVRTSTAVQEALAQSLRGLGVPAGEIPVEVADQTNLYRSLNADKRVLVVLGNVAGRCYRRRDMPGRGDQAAATCAAWPCSTTPHVHRLGALLLADAHALLIRILGADRVTAEPEAAADLSKTCGYLRMIDDAATILYPDIVRALIAPDVVQLPEAHEPRVRTARARSSGATTPRVRSESDSAWPMRTSCWARSRTRLAAPRPLWTWRGGRTSATGSGRPRRCWPRCASLNVIGKPRSRWRRVESPCTGKQADESRRSALGRCWSRARSADLPVPVPFS